MGRLDPANGARPGHVIYDLGCGAGNISRILAERFPMAEIVGIDSRRRCWPRRARRRPTPRQLRPDEGRPRAVQAGQAAGILYSNAAYHWLEGHIDMFPGLLKLLPSGGQLAIQMPRNHEAPSHALMSTAAEAGPWRDKLANVRTIRPVLGPERYYDVLKPLCSALELGSIYQQPLTGKDPVAQFTAGTGLGRSSTLYQGRRGRLLRHLCHADRQGLSDARRRHHALSLPPPVHRGAPRMMLRRLFVAVLVLLGFGPACRAAPQAMVAAANPLAVEAGLEMLRRGGSAVDAAIAVQMVLGVVEPQASGIGGGGFLLHYDGATAPSPPMTAARPRRPARRRRCSSTPTARRSAFWRPWSPASRSACRRVRDAGARAQEHGKLPWATLFEPAIDRQRDGFAVPPRLAGWLERMPTRRARHSRDLLQCRRLAQEAGERIANPALAETMRLIADQGARAFYEGDIAREMVERVRKHVRPGTLSLADLADYQPSSASRCAGLIACGSSAACRRRRRAASRSCRCWGCSNRSSSGATSPTICARCISSPRQAGSPSPTATATSPIPPSWTVPVAGLLSPAYLAERRKLISPDRSMGEVGPGVPPGYVERGTSHISIVDRWGNAVSFTTTIEAPFGSRLMVQGFLLNNELTDFSAVPEIDGKPVANRVEPGKRPRSSMAPTFVLDRDGSWCGSGIGGRLAHHRRYLAGRDRPARLEPVHAGRHRPAAGHQHERRHRAGEGPPIAALADALRALGHEVQVRRHDGGLTGCAGPATAGRAGPTAARRRRPRRIDLLGTEETAQRVLRAGEDRRVRAGHPWAFSNEILMDAGTKAIPPGSLATLRAPGGEALGLATFNPHSLIAARLLSTDPEARSMPCSSAGGCTGDGLARPAGRRSVLSADPCRGRWLARPDRRSLRRCAGRAGQHRRHGAADAGAPRGAGGRAVAEGDRAQDDSPARELEGLKRDRRWSRATPRSRSSWSRTARGSSPTCREARRPAGSTTSATTAASWRGWRRRQRARRL